MKNRKEELEAVKKAFLDSLKSEPEPEKLKRALKRAKKKIEEAIK